LEHQELRVQLVLRVLLAYKVLRALKVFKEQLVLVLRVFKVALELKVI
jgi:hypothetical protein